MGLTIHYQGQLKSMSDLPKLTSEIADICDTMNWAYNLIDVKETKPDDVNKVLGLAPGEELQLKGISFQPHPDCESVSMVFNKRGQLCSPVIPLLANAGDDPAYVWYGFTKTQFAGPDTHIALVRLLRYLEKRYFSKLEITDEGEYWETGNEAKLRTLFNQLTNAINAMAAALEDVQIPSDATTEDIVGKIEEVLKKLWKNKEVKDDDDE